MRNLNRFASILLTAIALAKPAAAQALPGDFVYLRDIDPSIIQDIRYAGVNNFMGRPMKGYGSAECVVKRSVGLALKGVQQELARQKLSLKMLDCYRPARAVADMVAWSQNGKETAAERRYNPAFSKQELFRLGYIATHSQHSTGAAVDLTLVDLTADNSAIFDPAKAICRLYRASDAAVARSQRRHGHRLRLFRCEGAYGGDIDHAGATPLAQSAGGGDGPARVCELFEGVVALFAAGRGQGGL